MASAIEIQGGRRLNGSIEVSGAKNSALPILAATLLCNKPVELTNLPELDDVNRFIDLLETIGMGIARRPHSVTLYPAKKYHADIPPELTSVMRASILLLAPLLSRAGMVELGFPGGCAIGNRPIDQHITGIKAFGASFELLPEKMIGTCDKLIAADFTFSVNSVTGSENLIMAASVASGVSTLRNVAKEPEVQDLIDFLVAQGAYIERLDESTLRITGNDHIGTDSSYTIIPDRIECGTFMVAAALCKGSVTITNVIPKHFEALTKLLQDMNIHIECDENQLTVFSTGPVTAKNFTTQPYPGIPTDMQAQLLVLNCVAEGDSSVIETIFENRFLHVASLQSMGAKITIQKNVAMITGRQSLQGADVRATDLRASAGLILAGLVATGTTLVRDIYHLDRGYENIVNKFCKLGASMHRVEL